MSYRILWIEDQKIHHLPPGPALRLAQDAPPIVIVYVTRSHDALARLKEGPFDAVIIDTQLDRGDGPAEDGLIVVEKLIAQGLLRDHVPRIVWSGTTRDGYGGKANVSMFPHWVARNNGREVLRDRLFQLLRETS